MKIDRHIYTGHIFTGNNWGQSAIAALQAEERPILLKLLFLSYEWTEPNKTRQLYSIDHSPSINWAQSEILALWAEKRPFRPIFLKLLLKKINQNALGDAQHKIKSQMMICN